MPTIDGNKLCPRCHEWKPATPEYFSPRITPKGTHTFHSSCRECENKKYQTPEYKQKAIERQRVYRANNYERYIQHKREYEEKTRAYHRAYTRAKYVENKDAILAERRNRYWNDTEYRQQTIAKNLEYIRRFPVKARVYGKIVKSRARARSWGVTSNLTSRDIYAIFDEQNGRCFYCGITLSLDIPKDVHTDHIVPFVKGGSNTVDNVVCTCADCNLTKAGRSLEEWQKVRGW